MHIFLDDERTPDQVTWVTLPKLTKGEEWTIVRNYDEFVKLLEEADKPPFSVCFDHDLGKTPGERERTGLSCAKAMIIIYMDKHWKAKQFPQCVVHSMNPVGKKNIEETLKSGIKWL